MPAPEPNPIQENDAHVIVSSRVFDYSRENLFDAFINPDHLVQWWGPDGFTNTIESFDPRPHGVWKVIMHGPDGVEYPSDNRFFEIVRPDRIVSRHLQPPAHNFTLSMLFVPESGQTRLTWHMLFESAGECTKLRSIISKANQQNFDRLQAFLKNKVVKSKTTSNENTADREILVSRVFDAPRELVWQAMTDPQHVIHWWGPRGFTTTVKTMEVRVGGAWELTMHGPDGANYPNKSIFKEVIKPERIVYSHGGGRENGPGAHFIATWSFEHTADDKTKLTIRMVFPSAKDRDIVVGEFGALEGARQTLERLSDHLPKMGTP
jgi:uncharacterized protein YndB with AHSA1/START domain